MTLKNHSLTNAPIVEPTDPLAGLDEKALLVLRARIDGMLKVDLSRLNLAEELGLQYRAGMAMVAEIQSSSDVPVNQQAQMFNSVSRMLQDIIKSQKVVYSAERLKRFEAAFLKVLGQLPAAQSRTYFDLYGEFLHDNPDALAELERIDPGITKS